MSEALALRHGMEKNTRTPPPEEALEPGAVRSQLDRILASKTFSRSPRISRFLTFVVEQTLAGQEDKLKEYLLGVEVFNRMDSFDPRIDSIVRVEARRLRYKLERYYETEGQGDSVIVQFRKGCYVPAFSNRNSIPDDLASEALDIPHLHVIGNLQAFSLFARGRYNLTRWTSEGVAEAVSCFSQALEEDPDCVGAYSGLATSWVFAGLFGLMPARDVMPKAKERAEQALMLRPTMPEPNAALGFVRAVYDWDWNEAEPLLRRAIQANPHDPHARLWYGFYSALCGRYDRAMHETHRGQQALPASLTAHTLMGFACHLARAYDEAVMHYRLAQSLDESFYPAYIGLGLLFADQNVGDKAVEQLTRANDLRPGNPLVKAALAYAHARSGNLDAAIQLCERLRSQRETQYVPPVARAIASASIGEFEPAMEELEEALEERSAWLACVPALPVFEPLHGHERFENLMSAVRLPHQALALV